MGLNSLHCAEVPIRNCSLTDNVDDNDDSDNNNNVNSLKA